MKKQGSYYDQKARCLKTIEKTVQSNPVKLETLYYFVMAEFGFSKKQTDSMIDLLVEADIVKLEDGVVKNVL